MARWVVFVENLGLLAKRTDLARWVWRETRDEGRGERGRGASVFVCRRFIAVGVCEVQCKATANLAG